MKNLLIVVLLLVVGFMLWSKFTAKEEPAAKPAAPVVEAEPTVSIVNKVDAVWGDGVVDGQTVLVFKNENPFPVYVRDFQATYNSVQGRTEEGELFRIVPDVLEPGETGYAVNDPYLNHIDYAEDFAGSEIEAFVSKKDYGDPYTKLEVSNVSYAVNPYEDSHDPEDSYGTIAVNGTMTNSSSVNVDGDKVDALALMYDGQNQLIGAFGGRLDKRGERLHGGEQFEFDLESYTLSRDLATRTARVDVVAGCLYCN